MNEGKEVKERMRQFSGPNPVDNPRNQKQKQANNSNH